MKPFQKILYLAGSTPADAEAWACVVERAASWGATLTLLEVTQPLTVYDAWLELPISARDLEARVREQRDASLRALQEHAARHGVASEVIHTRGKPHIEVIRAVIRGGYDLVAKQADTTKPGLFTRGAELALQRKCPCPVWLLKPTPQTRHARVVAAVDLQPDDAEQTALNRKIVEMAVLMAEFDKFELDVVNTWELPGEAAMRTLADIPEATIEKFARDVEQLRYRWMNEFLEPFRQRYSPCAGRVVRGAPEEVLLKLDSSEPVGLLVMGTQARTGIPGFLIGNTAEFVLGHVDCAVMTVKPDGFVSPVLSTNR
ncbi:MAG: universal stress protein [Planctomycetaceae bacterium]|nr:universal stress protein [Planctomycetaceae bacterium]